MRAVWATAIAICVLVVGGRPSAEVRIRDHHAAQLDVGHAAVVAPARRPSLPDGQPRPGAPIPVASFELAPPPVSITDAGAREPGSLVPHLVAARSARGPPHS